MRILNLRPAGKRDNKYDILCSCGYKFEEMSYEKYVTCRMCNKKELFDDLREKYIEWLHETYIDDPEAA